MRVHTWRERESCTKKDQKDFRAMHFPVLAVNLKICKIAALKRLHNDAENETKKNPRETSNETATPIEIM